MKKLIFFCCLLPLFGMGQNDSLRARQILKQAVKAMDFRCSAMEYKFKVQVSYDGGSTRFYDYKYILDRASNIQKIKVNCTSYTVNKEVRQPEFQETIYSDLASDTTFMWDEVLKIIKVGNFDLSKWQHHYIDDNFFKINRRYIDAIVSNKPRYFDSAQHTFRKNLSLRYKGLEKVNNKPCYVVEHIERCPLVGVETHRYPDYKYDNYRLEITYCYFYIDTTDYILKRMICFSKTPENDTIFYRNQTLQSYSFDSFTDIDFDLKQYPVRKIISFSNNGKERCADRMILKDLSGKAPNITGLDANEETFSLYHQKAKCYVLDFMYANCPVCIVRALPFWKEMKEKYNNPDIQYLVIDPLDNMAQIKKMIQDYDIQIPVIQSKKARKDYVLPFFPACYILDENFKILYSAFDLTDCDKKNINQILSSYHQDDKETVKK